MRSQFSFGKLWKRLSSSVVQDVPPALDECERCREVECTHARAESCERRLAAEAVRMPATKSPNASAENDPAEATVSAVEADMPRKPKLAPS